MQTVLSNLRMPHFPVHQLKVPLKVPNKVPLKVLSSHPLAGCVSHQQTPVESLPSFFLPFDNDSTLVGIRLRFTVVYSLLPPKVQHKLIFQALQSSC